MAPDYARFIAQSNGFQVGILDAVYRSILRQTWDAMARGESISWPNLFTFSAYTRKERIGRNPRTGDTITIPARLAVRVRAAQSFIKQIN
jgi:DNA-binding protein HU-beta